MHSYRWVHMLLTKPKQKVATTGAADHVDGPQIFLLKHQLAITSKDHSIRWAGGRSKPRELAHALFHTYRAIQRVSLVISCSLQ